MPVLSPCLASAFPSWLAAASRLAGPCPSSCHGCREHHSRPLSLSAALPWGPDAAVATHWAHIHGPSHCSQPSPGSSAWQTGEASRNPHQEALADEWRRPHRQTCLSGCPSHERPGGGPRCCCTTGVGAQRWCWGVWVAHFGVIPGWGSPPRSTDALRTKSAGLSITWLLAASRWKLEKNEGVRALGLNGAQRLQRTVRQGQRPSQTCGHSLEALPAQRRRHPHQRP